MTSQVKKVGSRAEKLTVVQPPDRIADETAKFLLKWPTKCLTHEEVVTRYCIDHDALLCNVCELTSHKPCGNVLSLSDASKGIRSSRDCAILENEIKKLMEKYEKMHKEQIDILTNLQEQDKEFIRGVKEFRREINALLDRLEHAVLANKDDYAAKRRDLVKENKHSYKTAMSHLETYSKDLHRNFLGPDDQSMFVAAKKTKVVLSKYSEQLKVIAQAPKKVFLTFQPNKAIAKFFMTLKEFGEMKADQSVKTAATASGTPRTDKRTTTRGNSTMSFTPRGSSLPYRHSSGQPRLQSRKTTRSEVLQFPTIVMSEQIQNNFVQKTRRPVHTGDVSVCLDTDAETPFVSGLTFMEDDSVIVADEANKNVKLFTHVFKPVAMVTLKSPPRDVTTVKSRQIIVTIPSEKALQFIDLAEELLLRNKINLEFECYGVTFFQNEFYVTSGFSNNRSIVIVSLNGKVRKRICPGIADLRYPLYIAVDPQFRTIFVTDYNHGVIGLDANSGDVRFKCKNTDVHTYYKGITAGHKGSLFVCTWNLHGVSRVHLDGRGLETVVPMPGREGRKPQCLAFSKKSERLIVSLCGGKRSCISLYRYQ